MTPPRPAFVLGCDDGGDLFPCDSERGMRLYFRAVNAIAEDLAERDGTDVPSYRFSGGIQFTTPIPEADPKRIPARGETWRRLPGPGAAPTTTGDVHMTMEGRDDARILDAGPIADVVTRGRFGLVEASAIWGRRWPKVAIVVYRVGLAKRWSYAARFVGYYAPPEGP